MDLVHLVLVLAGLAVFYLAIGVYWHRDSASAKTWGPNADEPVDLTPTARGWSCPR